MKNMSVQAFLDESYKTDDTLIHRVNEDNMNTYPSSFVNDVIDYLQNNMRFRKDAVNTLEVENDVKRSKSNTVLLDKAYDKKEEYDIFINKLLEPTKLQRKLNTVGKQKRNTHLYYESMNELLKQIIIFLVLFNIFIALPKYLSFIPLISSLSFIGLVLVTLYQGWRVLYKFTDHVFRQKNDFEKYHFLGLQLSETTSSSSSPSKQINTNNPDVSSEDYCQANECCPSMMYYNEDINMCDFM